jgi:hypothetical protein
MDFISGGFDCLILIHILRLKKRRVKKTERNFVFMISWFNGIKTFQFLKDFDTVEIAWKQISPSQVFIATPFI